jgi:TonB family protein
MAIAPFLLKSSGDSSPFNMLSMRAETQPGLVRLRWNPSSKVLENAQGAVVWIADGPEESKLELSDAQLRSGLLDYKTSGSDVNFRMEIGPFTESLRVENAVPATSEVAAKVSLPVVTDNVAPRQETPRKAEHRRTAREPDIARPAPMVDVPVSARAQAPKDEDEVSSVKASAERPSSSVLKKAFGWIPGVRKKDYVPPKVVRQVQPRVSTPQDTSVIVRVSIDTKGVVKGADLLTKGIDNQIGRSTVEAAKRWRFEPARADDRAVASNMVLRFRFEGTRN